MVSADNSANQGAAETEAVVTEDAVCEDEDGMATKVESISSVAAGAASIETTRTATKASMTSIMQVARAMGTEDKTEEEDIGEAQEEDLVEVRVHAEVEVPIVAVVGAIQTTTTMRLNTNRPKNKKRRAQTKC